MGRRPRAHGPGRAARRRDVRRARLRGGAERRRHRPARGARGVVGGPAGRAGHGSARRAALRRLRPDAPRGELAGGAAGVRRRVPPRGGRSVDRPGGLRAGRPRRCRRAGARADRAVRGLRGLSRAPANPGATCVTPYPGRVPVALHPRYWGGHLLALVLVALACRLGLWQLDSWQAHREAEVADFSDVTPVPLLDVIGPDDPFPGDKVGRPVELSGTWVPEGTVYIEGREHDGEDGYWAATPVEVDGGGGSALYVVRGWTPSPAEAPAPPVGPAEVTAYFEPTEGTNASDPDRTDDVLPQVRTADLVQHVDQDLFSGFGIAREPFAGLEEAELDQVSQASAFTGLKNFLYGIEWFVFGGFAAFIWWRWSRELAAPRERDEDAADEPVTSTS
ncbi:hypothetical protein GGQ24_03965 [Nocardioides sp. zg-578]|nr:hypothetical protein [Nocardioides marmotae]